MTCREHAHIPARRDVCATRGKVKVHLGATLPLSEASEAQRRLAARETTGKLLLLL
ncbi:MAG: zinc-binding dehydrogenase [Acidobacteriota bacterium]